MTAASEFDGFRLVVTNQNQETEFKIAEVKSRGAGFYEITSVVSPNAGDQSSLWFSFADYGNFFDKDALVVESGAFRLCSEIPGELLLLLENLEPHNFPEHLSKKLGFEYRVGYDVITGGYSVYRFFENTSELLACGCSGKTDIDFILDWILYRTAFAYPIIELENIIADKISTVKLHRVTADFLDICLISE